MEKSKIDFVKKKKSENINLILVTFNFVQIGLSKIKSDDDICV